MALCFIIAQIFRALDSLGKFKMSGSLWFVLYVVLGANKFAKHVMYCNSASVERQIGNDHLDVVSE